LNALIAKSPSLQADLEALREKGWKIRYTGPGDKKGSYAERYERPPHIVIDRRVQDPVQITQILAHEVGHAAYDYDYKSTLSSLESYILGAYGDEGMAVMNEMRVRDEILSAGGPDLGISGGDGGKYQFYKDRLDDLKYGRIDLETTRNAIGAVYVQGGVNSVTEEPYEKYHGDWYNNIYLPSLQEHMDQNNSGKANGKN